MRTQYTPGPWKAVSALIDNAPNRWMVAKGGWGGLNIADCGPDAEADARLIAAAPELVAFAEGMVGYLEMKLAGFRQDYPEDHCMVQTAIRYLAAGRAVIAKARGAA